MTEPQPSCVLFSEFQEVPTEDVEKILSKGKLKSCDLDPLPAAIVKHAWIYYCLSLFILLMSYLHLAVCLPVLSRHFSYLT